MNEKEANMSEELHGVNAEREHGGRAWIEHGKERDSTFRFSISKHLKPSVR